MELEPLLKELASGVDKTKQMLEKLIEDYPIPAISILTKCQEYEIVGNDLYRLYDISNKDYYLMQHLIYRIPTDILKKACARGGDIKTIQEWIDSYNP